MEGSISSLREKKREENREVVVHMEQFCKQSERNKTCRWRGKRD
jgi:hypothetical protein